MEVRTRVSRYMYGLRDYGRRAAELQGELYIFYSLHHGRAVEYLCYVINSCARFLVERAIECVVAYGGLVVGFEKLCWRG